MATGERETVSLIGSDKVEGTSVYGANDTQIGSIERVMIDKRSGKVSYAVLSFGGFLGIGDDHYPIPWIRSILTPIWVVTAAASPNSSCKVRQSTATTTNGVGKMRPARGRLTITMGSSLPEPAFPQACLKGGLCAVETETPKKCGWQPGAEPRSDNLVPTFLGM